MVDIAKKEECRLTIIAEAGVNHNGDIKLAHELIDLAKRSGAGIVKFQTFRAEAIVSASTQTTPYQEKGGFSGSQFDLLKGLELPSEAWVELAQHCKEVDIKFMSTPFDEQSAELLVNAGVQALKVSSGDLTNTPFLRHLAAYGLPLLISTGMGTMGEVQQAVVAAMGAPELKLLHCVSSYPAPLEQCNLSAIKTMQEAFNIEVGWSDHTTSDTAAIMAVAYGATLFEKHITLDRTMPGPDHAASADEAEIMRYVQVLDGAFKAIGDGVKRRQPAEEENAVLVRRSLHLARDIDAGEILKMGDVIITRPEGGMSPSEGWEGKRVSRVLRAGDPLCGEDLDA